MNVIVRCSLNARVNRSVRTKPSMSRATGRPRKDSRVGATSTTAPRAWRAGAIAARGQRVANQRIDIAVVVVEDTAESASLVVADVAVRIGIRIAEVVVANRVEPGITHSKKAHLLG